MLPEDNQGMWCRVAQGKNVFVKSRKCICSNCKMYLCNLQNMSVCCSRTIAECGVEWLQGRPRAEAAPDILALILLSCS